MLNAIQIVTLSDGEINFITPDIDADSHPCFFLLGWNRFKRIPKGQDKIYPPMFEVFTYGKTKEKANENLNSIKNRIFDSLFMSKGAFQIYVAQKPVLFISEPLHQLRHGQFHFLACQEISVCCFVRNEHNPRLTNVTIKRRMMGLQG